MFKVQKVVIELLILMTTFSFVGCIGKIKEASLPEALNNIKSYEAYATITFLAEGQENSLEMEQKVEIGGKYQLTIKKPPHLKDYILYFDGEKIREYNPKSQKETLAEASHARNETMLSTFIERYRENKDILTSKRTLDDKEVFVIEAGIPGGFKYLAKQRVYFEQEHFSPIKMEILDSQGNKTIQIEYKDFKYNSEIKWDIS